MQNPNEDTEWNDVLRAKGILPPKEEATISEDTVIQVYTNTEAGYDSIVSCSCVILRAVRGVWP